MAKKLSPAMFAWAKANKSKLKNPTAAQKKIFAAYAAMVKAGDKPANPKPRPTPKPAPKTQPKSQPKSDPKPKPADKTKPADKGGSGVTGQFRKSGDPGPNVTVPYGQIDRSTARVRRNQEDARRSRNSRNADVRAASGSNRRNDAAIKAEVDRYSGGSKEAQRREEERRRRAREAAARRNRNEMRLRNSGEI